MTLSFLRINLPSAFFGTTYITWQAVLSSTEYACLVDCGAVNLGKRSVTTSGVFLVLQCGGRAREKHPANDPLD
jgi:hypothetical protein